VPQRQLSHREKSARRVSAVPGAELWSIGRAASPHPDCVIRLSRSKNGAKKPGAKLLNPLSI
jgi:hypothetical protein